MNNAFSIAECKYKEKDKLEFYLKSETKIEKLSESELYCIIINTLYVYCLSINNKDYKFESYDFSSIIEHAPYIPPIIDIEIFSYLVDNPTDMFLMLEVLTLQAMYLECQDDTTIDVGLFKTLNQKIINKIREYKNNISSITQETLDQIKNIFNIFDGHVIAHVDFEKISNMIKYYKTDYAKVIKNVIPKTIQDIMEYYQKNVSGIIIYIDNIIVYKS